jgi:pyrimidine operon attenuation protein/uracil phosphoribosyltransferase
LIKKTVMDSLSIDKTLNRLSHEILERVSSFDKIILIGIHKRGVPLAARIRNKIKEISGKELKTGALDITFHRDDYRERLTMPEVKGTEVPFNLDGQVVILIDDVLYTGRTIRAALEELNSFGRAERVQLAVLVDRGHRELPIKADFVGKNIPTHEGEHVDVLLEEIDNEDCVILLKE